MVFIAGPRSWATDPTSLQNPQGLISWAIAHGSLPKDARERWRKTTPFCTTVVEENPRKSAGDRISLQYVQQRDRREETEIPKRPATMPREGGLKNNDESGWGSSDVKEGASSVNEANRGDFCCARRLRFGVCKRKKNASENLCGRTSKNRGSPESKMGEGEGKEREAEGPRYAQEANDLSRRPKEDRSSATRSMGEGKEGSQVTQSVHPYKENGPPILNGKAGVVFVVEGQMECRTKDELEAHVSDIRSLAASPNLSSKEKEAVARAERFAIGLLKEHDASGHGGKKCPYATQLFY